MAVPGSCKASVAAPAVGLYEAPAGDRRPRGRGEARGAGVLGEAQVGAAQAPAGRLLGRHCDYRLLRLAASAARRLTVLAADEALVELHDAAQHDLALAARHGMGDLAPHQPSGLGGDAELSGKLGRRRRLLGGRQKPDRQEPLRAGRCACGPAPYRRSVSLGSGSWRTHKTVSYTHLRAHETDSYLVCRLLLEKKKKKD